MIVIRPIGLADAAAFRAFVERLSPQARYERFQYVVKEVSPSLLKLLVEGDPRTHVADQFIWLSSYYPSKSICHETAHLYMGRGLVPGRALPDETEFFERAVFPFEEALRMVETSEIRDSMTVIAVLHAACLRAKEEW